MIKRFQIFFLCIEKMEFLQVNMKTKIQTELLLKITIVFSALI